MKKIIIFALICLAFASGAAELVVAVAGVVVMWYVVYKVLKGLGILSAPRTVTRKVNKAVNDAWGRHTLLEMIRDVLSGM